eukprot:gene13722-13844_t
MIVEVCVDSLRGAKAAEAAGAHRVELCAGLIEGGITPSYGLVDQVRGALKSTKLMVLIRPRGGDFVYTEDEMAVMKSDISVCARLGADGVVLGCLTVDGQVDMQLTGQLLAVAKHHGLDVTFHRAFDMTRELSEALKDVIQLGIPRVLTSGGQQSALQGADTLRALVVQAAGRVTLMAGGGVNSSNAAWLMSHTGVSELHSSAKRRHQSPMLHKPSHMSMCSAAAPSDWEWNATSQDEIRSILEAAGQFGNH